MPSETRRPRRSAPAGSPGELAALGHVLQVKVTLAGIRPPIWRRLLVRDTTTVFHEDLQVTMGWTNSHLHQFRLPSKTAWRGEVIEEAAERRLRLGHLLTRSKDRLVYEYDMGDSWEHLVVLERTVPPAAGMKYPWVLAGRRACPPEDVGGVPGYAHFLAVLADPMHLEHAELLDWAGGEFDAEAFDVGTVNAALHAGWVKRG